MSHCVRPFQASLSMGFSRKEYWSELPFPPPGDFPDPGIKLTSPMSPALVGKFFYHMGHPGSLVGSVVGTLSGLSRWLIGKETACQFRRCRRCGFKPRVRKIPWRRKWQLTPVFFPEKSHRQKSLVGYSPRGLKEWDRN